MTNVITAAIVLVSLLVLAIGLSLPPSGEMKEDFEEENWLDQG